MSKNKLTELPDDFGRLFRLQHLDLYGNKLQHLPLSFADFPRLKWLDLKDNPLENELKKAAGDCANSKQCELCASKVVQFMKAMRKRVEDERRQRELEEIHKDKERERLKAKQQLEREKRKAKNARRAAKKTSIQSENGTEKLDEFGNEQENETLQDANSSKISIFPFLLYLFVCIFVLSSAIIFGLFLAIHLRNGNKLINFQDIQAAMTNGFSKLNDIPKFYDEVSELSLDLFDTFTSSKFFNFVMEKEVE